MYDRRAMERFAIVAPAKVTVATRSGKAEVLDLLTRDISAAGAFLRTGREVAVGVRVMVEAVIVVDGFREIVGTRSRFKVKLGGI